MLKKEGLRQALQALKTNLGSSEIGHGFHQTGKFSLESDSSEWQDAKRNLSGEHYSLLFRKVTGCGKNNHNFRFISDLISAFVLLSRIQLSSSVL